MEENTKATRPPYQLISFVMDNSAACARETLAAMMSGFRRFAERQAQNGALEWELICYDTFECAPVKTFATSEIAPVFSGRMPLLGRATRTCADRLLARAAELREQGYAVHRPFLFLLTDGFTLDDVGEVAALLDAREREGALVYLPFRLSSQLHGERMQLFDRVKHMIEICEGHTDDFFAFVERMISLRAELPFDQPMKFSKTDFEGWALL